MKCHANKTEDEYQIISNDTGNILVTVSLKLSNAWYLTQACISLLLLNDDSSKKIEGHV